MGHYACDMHPERFESDNSVYQVWSSDYKNNSATYLGCCTAPTFKDACKYVLKLNPDYNVVTNTLGGSKLYCTEYDARTAKI
jgi:hypothetical protein